MQLVLVLAVLMMLGGKSGGASRPGLSSSDMLEMLKYISDGNGEMDKIFKEVEQVTEIVNTLAPIASAFGASANNNDINISESDCNSEVRDTGLILQPIANIADNSIYNALSHAI